MGSPENNNRFYLIDSNSDGNGDTELTVLDLNTVNQLTIEDRERY
jgi:hypothetical protein